MAFRILSLDGGGTWALIQARVLKEKYGENATGHEILKKYDMAIANSGGSLVLALLCANVQLKEIIGIFNTPDVLKSIFKKKFVGFVPQLKRFLPNYDTENKYEVFRHHLDNGSGYGDKLLKDFPDLIGKPGLQIIITSFDYDRERAIYFRSNHESMMESYMIQNKVLPDSGKKDSKMVTLAQAVHGASNAPVQFFDDPAAFQYTRINDQGIRETKGNKRLFWDGAVGGNNNPVKSAVLEAIANNADPNEIEIVSIGTANTVRPVIYHETGEPEVQHDFLCRYSQIDGWIEDLSRMANSILSDPPDSATFEVHQILRLPYQQNIKRLIRINPLIKPRLINNKWTMPGIPGTWSKDDMEKLFTMDMAVATDEGIKILKRLCDDFFRDAFDNQGIRLGGANIEPILGHKLFSHAMADWGT